ncbi:MAG: hypothetical protein Q8N04_12385 [Nitrospira sp.]|nr:hypothetical protein [Nitrospira sp.]
MGLECEVMDVREHPRGDSTPLAFDLGGGGFIRLRLNLDEIKRVLPFSQDVDPDEEVSVTKGWLE